jgi:hypothetical protein
MEVFAMQSIPSKQSVQKSQNSQVICCETSYHLWKASLLHVLDLVKKSIEVSLNASEATSSGESLSTPPPHPSAPPRMPVPKQKASSKRQNASNNVQQTPKCQKVGAPSPGLEAAPIESWTPPFEPLVSRHTNRRIRNAAAWDERLPLLIYPLMKMLPKLTLNNNPKLPKLTSSCLNGCMVERKTIRVISFGGKIMAAVSHSPVLSSLGLAGIDDIKLPYCSCITPSICLIEHGCFPSTPTNFPKWAFDIHLLEHATLQFRYGTPNISAWCHSTIAFMKWCQISDPPSYVSREP